jgi:hypothetical protein
MKALLGFVPVCGVLIGIFLPRIGTPLSGCANQGLEAVWIAPPDSADIIRKCRKMHPDATIPDQPLIITEKVFEEVERCNIFNFQGRRYLHRVRYRSELFLTNSFPSESIVVIFDYDHFHLNGGGCQCRGAE